MIMFIHFFCLCPLSLAIKLNFNISKVVYCMNLSEFEGSVLPYKQAKIEETCHTSCHPRLNQLLIPMMYQMVSK